MFISVSGGAPDPSFVRAVLAIAMAGVALDSCEILATRRLYAPGAIFGGRSNSAPEPVRDGVPEFFSSHTGFFGLFSSLDRLVRYRLFLFLAAVQIPLAALAVAIPEVAPYAIALAITLRLLSIVRYGSHGSEGADHMLMLVLGSLLIYFFAPTPLVQRVVLWFLAAETLLAYITAGVVKLKSRRWRQGGALRQILSTTLFECRPFVVIAGQRQQLIRVLHWMVIFFECAAPFLVFTGPTGCLIFLAMGAMFHLSISVMQGLNLFVFAFGATYPAVLYTSLEIARAFAGN
jgi:hypothetical protein